MPKSWLLASLPNEDGLYAALEKMEAKDAASITILRKRSQHESLRNIISGLWFAILYRAVERHTGYDKAVRKDSRCRAICNLTACLRAGNEISGHNNNISKVISKRMRSGVASWRTILQEPGLLAIVNFSNPPSKEALDELQSTLEDDDLYRSTIRYRTVIQRVLIFIDKTLKTTESLYRYLKNALWDVTDLVNDDDVDDPATSLLSQHRRRQDQLINTDIHTGLESSYNSYSISLETAFNKNTHPQHTVPYDSPILICVQSGDINATRALFQAGMASVYDVDPYNLGLLYVRGGFSYCKLLLMYL